MKTPKLICAGALLLVGSKLSNAEHNLPEQADGATPEPQESQEENTPTVISRLTDDDYREVAERLGVEVAAIKAVVDIEAGRAHEGFFLPEIGRAHV